MQVLRWERTSPLSFWAKNPLLHDRKPLVWAGGGYGGQVAVRFDSKKVIRRNLFPGKKPDNWEV